MEDKTSHDTTRIDLTDIDGALDQVAGQVAVAPHVSAAVVPSEEYMDDVMSITSQSRGGSLVADAPEDEEVLHSFTTSQLYYFVCCVYITLYSNQYDVKITRNSSSFFISMEQRVA